MALLETSHLTVSFGGLKAVDDVGMRVEEGSLVGLIGPNGAGKTTFIDALTGFVPYSGVVEFAGRNIEGQVPHRRAQQGLARTWQSIELFADLSVRQNLKVAAEKGGVRTFLADLVWPCRKRDTDDTVEEVLRQLQLEPVADRLPDELSNGQRKLVGVGRALVTRAPLILLDEPAAGLDTRESLQFATTLRSLVDSGLSLLLIDHDMGLVLRVCDYIYVLEFGKLIAEGAPGDIRTNDRVITAYLGESAKADIDSAHAALTEVDVETAT